MCGKELLLRGRRINLNLNKAYKFIRIKKSQRKSNQFNHFILEL